AAATGVASVLSAPMVLDVDVVGSLNMYGERPEAFADADIQFARLFGFEVAMAFELVHAREQSAEQAEQFQQALLSRDVIGQAKGIIMERERITADQAFDIL